MNANTRRIIESPIYQGEDERVAYALTTTPWGSNPASVAVVLKDEDGTNVSATYLTGSASTVGDVITTPVVISLVDGQRYRLEIKFTIGTNTFETWTDIYGQK